MEQIVHGLGPPTSKIKSVLAKYLGISHWVELLDADGDGARANVCSENPLIYLGLRYSESNSEWVANVLGRDSFYKFVEPETNMSDAQVRETCETCMLDCIEAVDSGDLHEFGISDEIPKGNGDEEEAPMS